MRVPAFGRKLGLDSIDHAIGNGSLLMAGSVHVAFAAVVEMFANARTVAALPYYTSGIAGTIDRGVDARDVSKGGEEVGDSRWSRLWLNAVLVQA